MFSGTNHVSLSERGSESRKTRSLRLADVYMPLSIGLASLTLIGVLIMAIFVGLEWRKATTDSVPVENAAAIRREACTRLLTQTTLTPPSCSEVPGCPASSSAVVTLAEFIMSNTNYPGEAEHCRVMALVDGRIRVEARLPTKWSGIYATATFGGFGGNLAGFFYSLNATVDDYTEWMNPGLTTQNPNSHTTNGQTLGYVVSITDMGHTSDPGDNGIELVNSPVMLRDFLYRADILHPKVVFQLIRAYYGYAHRKALCFGCSGGGRRCAMVAARSPTLYNGVVAGCASWNLTRSWAVRARAQQVEYPVPEGPPAVDFYLRNQLIQQSYLDKCDASDGILDGWVADPLSCPFSYLTDIPSCGTGPALATCLTPAEAMAMTNLTQMKFDGVPVPWTTWYPNEELAGFNDPGYWVQGDPPTASYDPAFLGANEQYLYWALRAAYYPRTDIAALAYNLSFTSSDFALLEQTWGAGNNPLNMTAFAAAGGKMIMWAGYTDANAGAEYARYHYNIMTQFFGGNVDQIRSSIRLFLVPTGHCGYGFMSEFDVITALSKWVLDGSAPDSIKLVRSLYRPADTRERIICAEPKKAVLKSVGLDPNSANSWTCGNAQTTAVEAMAIDGNHPQYLDKRTRY